MSVAILLEEAWERLFALAPSTRSETIPVGDAAGRYLAADLLARRTRPASDQSAMDGFAVAGAGPWTIVGEARAGASLARELSRGEAARISTGAACPTGTDGIVIVEEAAVTGSTLRAPQPERGRWIRRRGFDFADGEVVLGAGSRIDAAQLALARAAGHARLTVGRQPSVAVIEIGDELVDDLEDCACDRLPASNGMMVATMARGAGASARTVGPLPDDRAAVTRALVENPDAQVIVTTAGASVGEHDHVRGALEDIGADLAFWRVAIRPGKPLLVARRQRPRPLGDQLVLGLPGNPASAYVTAYLFLLPLLRAMQGAAHPLPAAVPLPLAAPFPAGGDRREFQRARFVNGQVLPLAERDSSSLRTLAAADLLIDRAIGAPPAAAGDPVPCWWLGHGPA